MYESKFRERSLRQQSIFANYPCLRILNSPLKKKEIKVTVDGCESRLQLQYCTLELNKHTQAIYENLPNTIEWEPLQALKTFHEKPSAFALANLLQLIESKNWEEIFGDLILCLPWPLGTAVYTAAMEKDFSSISAEAMAGGFGDTQDWQQAEERWAGKGVDRKDFELSQQGRFFTQTISTNGWPVSQCILREFKNPSFITELIEIASSATGGPKSQIIDYVEAAIESEDESLPLSLETVRLLFSKEYPGQPGRAWINPKMLSKLDSESLGDEVFLEFLNTSCTQGWVWILSHSNEPKQTYEFLISNSSKYPGLLVALIKPCSWR